MIIADFMIIDKWVGGLGFNGTEIVLALWDATKKGCQVVNLVYLSCKGAVVDRKPVFSTEHLCELCLWNVHKMVPMVENPLVGLDPVLRDKKNEF